MDMSFADRALVVGWLTRHGREMNVEVHTVPRHIDEEVARLKLDAMGMAIDTLTDERRAHLSSWQEGT